jgi:hypothetical protein
MELLPITKEEVILWLRNYVNNNRDQPYLDKIRDGCGLQLNEECDDLIFRPEWDINTFLYYMAEFDDPDLNDRILYLLYPVYHGEISSYINKHLVSYANMLCYESDHVSFINSLRFLIYFKLDFTSSLFYSYIFRVFLDRSSYTTRSEEKIYPHCDTILQVMFCHGFIPYRLIVTKNPYREWTSSRAMDLYKQFLQEHEKWANCSAWWLYNTYLQKITLFDLLTHRQIIN